MFRHTAHVYDLVYEAAGKDYPAESAGVRTEIQSRNPEAKSLLDVACGTGEHLRHLRHHYTVTGVDLDPAMLTEARAKLPDIRLELGDMRDFELGTTFDAVICLFSSIGYMRDTAELDQAIAAMAHHLCAGGVLVVDGWVRPDAWRVGGSTQVEVASNEDVKVARVSRAVRSGDKTQLELHHLIATADNVDYVVDHHELTLFAPEHYEAAFRRSGLSVEVVPGPMEGRDRYIGVKPE